jgi:hypothetical protein
MGDDIILILAPFVKLDALRELRWSQATGRKLKIVCRWAPQDLVLGVSDLDVFNYLTENGCELYINPTIHLKLYVFASNLAFNTSGNLTKRGLGYAVQSNIEAGNMVQLESADWRELWRIVLTSRQVDQGIYERFKAYIDSQRSPPPIARPDFLGDLVGKGRAFTISSLPATPTVAQIAEYYFNPLSESYSPEDIRRATHDLIVFAIPDDLNRENFEARLGEAFRRTPFIEAFVAFLRTTGSLSFGAVTQWIQDNCDDVPLPYRWEIKESTGFLFCWLTHFFGPNVTWDVPGRYAQVIYWNEVGQ